MVVDKNHLSGIIVEESATIMHGGGIKDCAKSVAFVCDNVLVKRQVLKREKVIASEFLKLSAFSVHGVVGNATHLGQDTCSAKGGIT
eukprot:2983483-Ditylum_brightwellii.AAC.2